jgi:hypothetical protein
MSYVDQAAALVKGEVVMSDTKTFPFLLSDIKGWVVRRKDGVLVKYVVGDLPDYKPASGTNTTSAYKAPLPAGTTYHSLSEWCQHDPIVGKPIFRAEDGTIELYVADCMGGQKSYSKFDLALDCGKAVMPVYPPASRLQSRLEFAPELRTHVIPTKTLDPLTDNVMWIDWADRQAPPLYPEFWPSLVKILKERGNGTKAEPLRILTICQGGHGRSGSAAVCIMMSLTDYTPLEAITHLRAMHCARAIESEVQHKYLNLVGKHFGRVENALDAETVPDFKAAFLAMTNPFAAEMQAVLKAKESK